MIFGNFGDILLIATGEPNVLQKIYNYLEKAKNLSFFQMVVYSPTALILLKRNLHLVH